MHHRGPADDAAADDRPRAAPDASDAGAMAQAQAAQPPQRTRRHRASGFSPKALAFLRALKRNNDREWFKARKERYEALLRAPMIDDDRAAGGGLPDVRAGARGDAEGVAVPNLSRHAVLGEQGAAQDAHRGGLPAPRICPKHQGAGLYFHVAPDGVWVGGGMYAPETSQLQAVREHIAANVRRLRAIVESPAFRRTVGALEGERLQRVPRGFPAGSSGRRVPEVPPVSRRPRVPGALRHQSAFLRRGRQASSGTSRRSSSS